MTRSGSARIAARLRPGNGPSPRYCGVCGGKIAEMRPHSCVNETAHIPEPDMEPTPPVASAEPGTARTTHWSHCPALRHDGAHCICRPPAAHPAPSTGGEDVEFMADAYKAMAGECAAVSAVDELLLGELTRIIDATSHPEDYRHGMQCLAELRGRLATPDRAPGLREAAVTRFVQAALKASRVSPDDQQVDDEDRTPQRTVVISDPCSPPGGPTASAVRSSSRPVTAVASSSAGGESGLPHHSSRAPTDRVPGLREAAEAFVAMYERYERDRGHLWWKDDQFAAYAALRAALRAALAERAEVTRFEVIDRRILGKGRAFVAHDIAVELTYQDDGRTLKVFVTDRTPEAP